MLIFGPEMEALLTATAIHNGVKYYFRN